MATIDQPQRLLGFHFLKRSRHEPSTRVDLVADRSDVDVGLLLIVNGSCSLQGLAGACKRGLSGEKGAYSCARVSFKRGAVSSG